MEAYSRSETVRTYECGPDCLLKPDILLHWIQEIAEEHASTLGFGSSFCMEKNLAWVEVRLSIRVTRLPRWREQVRLSTWTYPASPLIAYRDFKIEDMNGAEIAGITSQWVLIDAEKRRPVALKKLITDFPNEEATPLVECAKEMPLPENMALTRTFTAERHHVDFNRHVNNAAYLVWALDSLPADWLEGKSLTGMEIAFKKETLPGEEISSCLSRGDSSSYHSLQANGQERARLILYYTPNIQR